jgi:hypothetical protein
VADDPAGLPRFLQGRNSQIVETILIKFLISLFDLLAY